MEKLRHNFDLRLTPKEILTIVDDYKKDVVPQVDERNDYAKGNNPAILKRITPSGTPDNRVPVPYARRITNVITSYMFKPGLISYASENQAYLDALLEIFEANKEELQSYQIGWQTTVHGVGYEMFYGEGLEPEPTLIDGQLGYNRTIPRFEKVPIREIIPIYDFDINPNLRSFIHFWTVEAEEVEYIDVYYDDMKVSYERRKEQNALLLVGEQDHGFARVPLVVYENNEDCIGDFAPVVPLIDAYDVLMSDSMNEFDRFAQAYLIAKGFTISEDDAEKMKHKRALSLMNPDDSIEFLTKPVETAFIQYLSDHLRAEIHRGSGIPNLDDYKWGGQSSGETVTKFIYLMDLFVGIKESYFKEGLQQRIELLTDYAGLPGIPKDIEVIMNRHEPDKSMVQADLLVKYSGHVSQKTLIENFADFVDNAEEELEAMAEESKMKADLFGLPVGEAEDEEDEEEPGGDEE